MQRIVCLFFLSIVSISSYAQPYDLKSCLARVTAESKSIKAAESTLGQRTWDYRQVKDAFIPSLSLSNQHNVSTGRVLDPTTYQFLTNRTVYDMSASVGGSLTLFNGFERVHQAKRAKLNVTSAEMDVERTKNDLALEVTRLFLKILMDKEAVEACDSKISLLKGQEDLIAKKVELKAATAGDLLNIQADVTRAQVERSSAMNELNLDKVSMCELLEIEDWESFDVAFDDEDLEPRLWNEEDVISNARSLPQIRQKEIAIEQAKKDVQISQSSYWPELRLNAGYGSTFSDARVKSTGEEYVFFDQLRDNMSTYVTASLSIPILSAITVSHSVKARKSAVRTSELDYQLTLLALDKEVKQAIVQTNTAYEQYTLLATEVDKAAEALRQTTAKYDVGAATYYDYQIAVGNLFQAKEERLRARYEYIYRTKVIGFFAGIPL